MAKNKIRTFTVKGADGATHNASFTEEQLKDMVKEFNEVDGVDDHTLDETIRNFFEQMKYIPENSKSVDFPIHEKIAEEDKPKAKAGTKKAPKVNPNREAVMKAIKEAVTAVKAEIVETKNTEMTVNLGGDSITIKVTVHKQ